MGLILRSMSGRTGVLQLNREDKRNSLNCALMEELAAGLDTLEKGGAHVLVIRAAPGVKVWSAGHDIDEIPAPGGDPLGYFGPLETLLRKVQDCPVPVIAMVEGSVWGGACDLCCSCDMVVAAPNATFAMTPAKIGIPYNASGVAHFANLLGVNKAKEMFFTAQPVSAEDARTSGLVNHVVSGTELETFTRNLADKISSNAPLAVRSIKAEFRLLARGHRIDAETAEEIQAIRRDVYHSADYAEGLRAFREKRAPKFEGR